MRQLTSTKKWMRGLLAGTLTLSLASCSTIPAFGPDADTISRSVVGGLGATSDVLPFEIIDVTATTLPSTNVLVATFPPTFRNQGFRSTDETVEVGDRLEIRIWEIAEDGLFSTAGRRETILEVVVSNSGEVALPYANTISAQGYTVAELRALLLDRYTGQAIEPEIAIAITDTQSRTVTVLGDARTLGRALIPSKGIKLLDLIAQVGGFPHAHWEMTVTIQRGTATASLSASNVISHPANNIIVLPGDIVNVTYEPRRFAVYGGVNRPSNIEIPMQKAHLAYLMADVGGLNDRIAQAQSVFVFRPVNANSVATTAIAYRFDFSRPDSLLLAGMFRLEPTDIIYVASADAADFQKIVSIVLSPLLGTAASTSNLGK